MYDVAISGQRKADKQFDDLTSKEASMSSHVVCLSTAMKEILLGISSRQHSQAHSRTQDEKDAAEDVYRRTSTEDNAMEQHCVDAQGCWKQHINKKQQLNHVNDFDNGSIVHVASVPLDVTNT